MSGEGARHGRTEVSFVHPVHHGATVLDPSTAPTGPG